jgi:hypothetical protein
MEGLGFATTFTICFAHVGSIFSTAPAPFFVSSFHPSVIKFKKNMYTFQLKNPVSFYLLYKEFWKLCTAWA